MQRESQTNRQTDILEGKEAKINRQTDTETDIQDRYRKIDSAIDSE